MAISSFSNNILITGANGLVARHLGDVLKNNKANVYYLTRNPGNINEFKWNIENQYIEKGALENVDTIIHLAGVSVGDQRWTKKRKHKIFQSRVGGATLILNELKKRNRKIKSFISASAIGYYGTLTSLDIFDETTPNGNDFLSEVCQQWENSAFNFFHNELVDQVIILRIGVVMAKSDSVLQKISIPIKYNLGSVLGTGNQFVPWIHIDDLSSMIIFLINNGHQGVFNAVAPTHITNKELTYEIARTIHKKIWLPHTPSFIIKSVLGEMSTILLNGSRVSSNKIKSLGFEYQYPTIASALKNLLS